MELTQLEIKGFRGFKSKQVIKFPIDKQAIVFVGVNGAGKTTILDAIRLGLQPFYEAFLNHTNTKLSRYNINVESEKMEIDLDWKYTTEHEEEVYKTNIQANKFDDKLDKTLPSEKILNLCSDIKSRLSLYKNQYGLGIMVYYPSNRLADAPNLNHTISESYEQFSALSNALTSSIDFKPFFDWFRLTEDIENEKRLTENPAHQEPQLQAVENAILSFLDGFSDLRIQRFPIVDMIIKKGELKLSVNQLSSGEKAILTVVGDLARRLAIANPGLKNPLAGRAVVLIDEVDLHLHPKWQKEIVSKLQKTFPNVQFILSSHSPLVINHLKTESIYLLENFECVPAAQTDLITYSADLDKLLAWQGLENGSIPSVISAEINKIATLIKENKLDEANLLLDKLKKCVDPNHPKLNDLATELEVKEFYLME